MDHSDDEKEELTLEGLQAQLCALKEENLTLGERVAEQELWHVDIEDKMDVLGSPQSSSAYSRPQGMSTSMRRHSPRSRGRLGF